MASSKATGGVFSYGQFRSLDESDLAAYMEPMLTGSVIEVSSETLKRMATELAAYDEYHAVYAIEFGMLRAPGLFADPVVRCLANDCQSVRLAAHRSLLWLPVEMISEDLIHSCEESLNSGGQYGDVADVVRKLREKKNARH